MEMVDIDALGSFAEIITDPKRFEENKRTCGCVIRSLESVLGARATDDEWRLRFAVLGEITSPWSLVMGYGIPKTDEERKRLFFEIERDMGYIKDFVEILRASRTPRTPLGEAIGQYNVKWRYWDGQDIAGALGRGNKVIYTTDRHFMHIGWAEGHKAVSLSDDGQCFSFEGLKRSRVLVFEHLQRELVRSVSGSCETREIYSRL